MATRRKSVLAALVTRLAAIQIANGFATDAGKTLVVGTTPAFGEDDPKQAIAILVGDDSTTWQQRGLACSNKVPYLICALSDADVANAWMTIEDLIGDIKRAIEVEDRTLGGLLTTDGPLERGPTAAFPREPGSTTVGAYVTYFAGLKEGWGTP